MYTDRLLNLELSLLGKWNVENNTFSYLFMDESAVGLSMAGLFFIIKYELFIKDEKMFIKIINDLNRTEDEIQINEYEVLEINPQKLLRLLTSRGQELRFHHDKGGLK